MRVVSGSVLDIGVDLRHKSKTFGQWYKVLLSAENKRMYYIPKGFAHGFLTLEDNTEFQYKCTDYYTPEFDSGILWNDKDININWDFKKYKINENEILLSEKDKMQQSLVDFLEKGVIL